MAPAVFGIRSSVSGAARLVDRGIDAIHACVAWLFSKSALGVDVVLAAVAFGWLLVIVANPGLMEPASFAHLRKVNREFWVMVLSVITVMHIMGIAAPWRLKAVRVAALFLSGWIWLSVGTTFALHITTGAPTYITIGFGALVTVIYVIRLRE